MLSKDKVLEGLFTIIGKERVIADEKTLRENSVDSFRKYATLHNVYELPLPIAVIYAKNTEEVSKILLFANENRINVIAKNGGTSGEGGLENITANTIILDGSQMNHIANVDTQNMQVTVGCGVVLADLEELLRKQGLTTGHAPQNKLAQIGGLVATRSSGTLSNLYGGIEDMVVGLESVFPNGTIVRIKNSPRRAAGPDIRQVIIGNEGAIAYITQITLKLFKYRPENNLFLGWLIDDMSEGLSIIREVMTNGLKPSVARLYSPEDAKQHFPHFYKGKCVLVFMTEGMKSIAKATYDEIVNIVDTYKSKLITVEFKYYNDAVNVVTNHKTIEEVDARLIEKWFGSLNYNAEQMAAEKKLMLEHKNIGFTTEISCDWGSVINIYESAIKRIRTEFPHAADITLLGAHSSHSYQNGTNLSFVYNYNVVGKPEEERIKYHIPLNAIIVEEALKFGGSMVHHHGIGKYRSNWIKNEHGSAYYILDTLKKSFDPNDIMNKGTIFKA
ncbi:MAG: FAD-binding oxidoreductase [Alphaproteobacteria bacterium]|jgi:alkyldihydroxyacetonephosphate synthase|nr:FAD-binding oxidoreductase [Alphaproteobacteria bacterium]